MPLLSANILVCESVLVEKTEVLSAIRMMDTIALAPGNDVARFHAVTRLTSQTADFYAHTLKVQVTDKNSTLITEAPEFSFRYGYRMEISGLGGFVLATEFALNAAGLLLPAVYIVTAFLDGQGVARTPLMLRR